MTEIAHGEISIGLNDRDALSGLHRVEAEFRAAMAAIDRQEAEANIKADTHEFDAKIKKVKDELKIVAHEKATATVDVDKKAATTHIKELRAELRRLEAERATVTVETRGTREALASIEAVKRAEASRARAEERYARQRQRVAQNEITQRAAAEKAASRASDISRKAELDAAREAQRISQLRQEYAKLTDQIEKAHSTRTPFGKEARIKLELQETGLRTRLEAIKAELDFLGGHPPAHIKIDTDERFLTRTKFKIGSFLADIGNKLSNIGHVRLNLGPFSGTLRTMTLAAAALGPVLVSLGGAATSLVGVLGTGIAGAASVAAGVLGGLALNFGGVLASALPAIQGFKNARLATTAYTKAVEKYGASSKQAKTAQQQMNNVLHGVDPNSRRAAIGLAQVQQQWHKLTGPTANRDIGKILGGGIKTLNALLPTLAHNSNSTFNILTAHLTHLEGRLRTPADIHMLDSLGSSANKFLGPVLSGFGHLGSAIMHVGESAARIFAGPAGKGFDKWANDINKATQPGAKLDSEIHRIGDHARDLLHLFDDVGKLLMTVFNGGANAGDNLVNTLDRAVTSWNSFLTSTHGRQSMSDFFNRSATTTKALASALAPLVATFVQWSSLLAPFSAGLLKGVTFVAKLVAGLTHLIGLGGPLAALGATLGAAFAIGKIGAFVGVVARLATVLGEAAKAAKAISIGEGVAVLARGLPGVLSRGGGAAAGAASAAASIEAAHVSGGQQAAAAILEAHQAGGAEAGAEINAAEVAGGAEAGAEIAAAETAGGAAGGLGALAGGAEVAGGGMLSTVAEFASRAVGPIAAVGAGLLAIKGLMAIGGDDSALAKYNQTLEDGVTWVKRYRAAQSSLPKGFQLLASTVSSARSAHRDLAQSLERVRKLEAEGKRSTQEYRDAVAELNTKQQAYNQAQKQQRQIQGDVNKLRGQMKNADNDHIQALDAQIKNEQAAIRNNKMAGASAQTLAGIQRYITQLEKERAAALTNLNLRQADATLSTLNQARAIKGLGPVSQSAARAFQTLTQKLGARNAVNIATKFAVPQDASAVARSASNTLAAGVKGSIVLHIIADAKDAQDALDHLRAAKLIAKTLAIHPTGDKETLDAIRRIEGSKIAPKVARILASSETAHAKIRALIALGIPPKVARILGDNSDAMAKARAAENQKLRALFQAIYRNAPINPPNLFTIPPAYQDIYRRMHGFPHASGLRPGSHPHDAIIGEGGGPEWHYNTRSGAAYKTDGPMMTRVGPNDAIIPTEPAHRGRGRDILSAIAHDLGLKMFKKGHPGKVPAGHGGKAPKPSAQHAAAGPVAHPAAPAAIGQAQAVGKALHVPKPFKSGGVPEQVLSSALTKVQSDYHSQASKLDTARRSYADAHKAYEIAKGKKYTSGKQKGQSIPVPAGTVVRLQKARQTMFVYEHGGKLPGSEEALPSLVYMRRQIADIKTADNQAKHANQNITHLMSLIEQERTDMSNASSMYAKTGDAQYLTAYNTAKGLRTTNIASVLTALGKAKTVADALTAKYPHSIIFQQNADDIGNQVGTADSAQTDNATDTIATPESPTAPTLDDYLKANVADDGQGGTLADELGRLTKAYALAQADTDPNNDQPAAAAIRDFYSTVLGDVQRDKQPDPVITEAANDFTTWRDTATSANQNLSPDAQAIADQANQRAQIAATGQHIAESALAAFTSPGDIGTGAFSSAYQAAAFEGNPAASNAFAAASSGRSGASGSAMGMQGAPNIIIQTLHPGDPATLAAVGRAATAGIGYQGYRDAPRENLGY